MWKGIKNGWKIIKESIIVFKRHPEFLVPLLFTWSIYAPVIVYMEYIYNWEATTFAQDSLVVFGVIILFASILAISCSVVLELLQQLETGNKPSLSEALKQTFKYNFVHIIPLIFVWAVIWFVITLVQALFARKKSSDDAQLSAENAAKTLAGFESFSFSRMFFESLKKGVRLIMFLILPAIAWENMSFVGATKKGMAVFKAHVSEFVSGFVLTEGAAILLFLPAAIFFSITDEVDTALPDFVWGTVIIYIAFAWSYSIYLEQMFAAELYLWNMKWEKKVAEAKLEGKPIPALSDIDKPSLLDEVRELKTDVWSQNDS